MVTAHDLIDSHLNLANSVAWKRQRNLTGFDIDDIKSAAYLGLCIAADKFNHNIAHFSTYARIKIDGAISDFVRETRGGKTHQYESMDDETYENLTQQASYQEILEQITENLCEEGKKIILMYYLEGLNLKEISVKLRLGVPRVSQILSKYRKQIKEEYQEK